MPNASGRGKEPSSSVPDIVLSFSSFTADPPYDSHFHHYYHAFYGLMFYSFRWQRIQIMMIEHHILALTKTLR